MKRIMLALLTVVGLAMIPGPASAAPAIVAHHHSGCYYDDGHCHDYEYCDDDCYHHGYCDDDCYYDDCHHHGHHH